jgi:hypothetical protein
MKAGKILVPIAVLGVVGAATYVIYRYFKKKNDAKKAPQPITAKPLPITAKPLSQMATSAENPFQLFPQGSTRPKEVFISTPATPRSLIFQPTNQQGNASLLRPKF